MNPFQHKLTVQLTSCGNPDHDQLASMPVCPDETREVHDLHHAADWVRAYITKHDLGAGNFSGGLVINNHGRAVARISYNGRIWIGDHPNNKTLAEAWGTLSPHDRGVVAIRAGVAQHICPDDWSMIALAIQQRLGAQLSVFYPEFAGAIETPVDILVSAMREDSSGNAAAVSLSMAQSFDIIVQPRYTGNEQDSRDPIESFERVSTLIQAESILANLEMIYSDSNVEFGWESMARADHAS